MAEIVWRRLPRTTKLPVKHSIAMSSLQRLPTWRGAPAMTAHETAEARAPVESRRRQRQLADCTGHPPAKRAAKLTSTARINGFERSLDRGGAQTTASGDHGVRQSTRCRLRYAPMASPKVVVELANSTTDAASQKNSQVACRHQVQTRRSPLARCPSRAHLRGAGRHRTPRCARQSISSRQR